VLQYVGVQLIPVHNYPFSIHPLRKSNFLSLSLDFTYYQLNRDGNTFLGLDIPGFPIGEQVDTDFDISILRGSYAWSFFKNEH